MQKGTFKSSKFCIKETETNQESNATGRIGYPSSKISFKNLIVNSCPD
jgi:hypothetical protein